MEKALRIILPIVIIVLAYILYESIAKPIREERRIKAIDDQIIERLEDIKSAQLAYKDLKGRFTGNFDTLIAVLENDQWPVIKVEGDPEDSNSVVTYDTTYIPMIMHAFPDKQVNLDSLPYVPFNPDGAKFIIQADSVYTNNIWVPVFEVSDPKPANPKRTLRLGNINEPVYTGNWE